jgi:cytochrome P450
LSAHAPIDGPSAASPKQAPGPPGTFLLGSLPAFARDPLAFLAASKDAYGDVVRFRLPGYEVFFLENPRDIENVLLTSRTNFVKHSFFWKHVTAIFGSGLLTSEGDFWLKQRRLAAPAFHPERIASYGQVMTAFTERHTSAWKDGEVRDLHRDMMRVTMEIVSKTLFDVEVAEDVDLVERSFDGIISEIAKRFRRPVKIPDAIPIPGNVRYNRGVAVLDRLVRRILAERRERPGDRGDLLSMLTAARDDDGQPMSDRQLRDELITLFLAGHETTAISLSWTFHLLSKNPAAEDRAAAEVREALKGHLPTAADLPRLPFVHAVFQESIRLYPPAYVIGREALSDCVIGGYRVPARATIYFSPWVLHRDRRWFDAPEEFRPERWLDGSASKLPKYAFIPFGGGPRICIGERFATMEAVLMIATILRTFRLESAGPDPVPLQSITLRPQGGPKMKITRRREA